MTAMVLLAATLAASPAAFHPSWATVLQRFVDERGRVDFAGIRADPRPLDDQVAFVATTDPSSFDDPLARLAFLLNAYNALAMYRAAHSGVLPESKLRFFYFARHQVGRRRMSLYTLENDVIRPLGDPRVHVALNCMVRGCPRLPREPFAPETLQAQLNAAAVEFFAEPRHVQVEPARRVVRFSAILDWYEDDFLAAAPSLIAYANRYRPERIPDGYAVEFLPYDWTLNAHE
jgi:hypothetical protein